MPDTRIAIADWLRPMEGILGALNEGVVIVDSQLRVVFANQALLRLGNFHREDVQGMRPDAIFPAKDIPHILRQHESGHRYGHSRIEFYLPGKNGERIPAIFSGRSIQAPDGEEYVLLIITDISAQKRVEGQLRESNALLEKRQREIETELSLAARVQQSLAPRNLLCDDLAVETYYKPAHTIGGDFGVVFPYRDEVLTTVICDVSGHGISSALIANRIYSETLHQLELNAAPGKLLRHLHDLVYHRLATDTFYFTMASVAFSRRGHRASFAAAGHPPAMLASNGSVRLLDSQNGILGCLAETAPSDCAEEIELAPGDRLVLYTDGLVEVFNSREEQLGIKGLKALVCESAKRPLAEMRKDIIDGVAAWSHIPLADDMSLIIVEVR